MKVFMIFVKAPREAVLSVLNDLHRMVSRRQAEFCPTPTISNGFPEAGGGGGSASTEASCTEATGTDATPEASSDDDDGGDGDSDPDGRQPHHPSPTLRALPCNAVKHIGATLPKNPDSELWRLPTVLQCYPVSRGTWLAGVRAGIYPKPVKIGIRAVAWKASDIRALVASL